MHLYGDADFARNVKERNKMTKTVLFLPGFTESIHSRDYKKLLKMIKSKGYNVKFIDVDWKHKTLTDWHADFMKIYEKYDPKNTILAGFSFGAVIALTVAETRNPIELWMFSLSPCFAEDFPLIWKNDYKVLGRKRIKDFQNYNFNEIAQAIKCPVLLLAGEKEMERYTDMKKRFEIARKKLTYCHAIIVPHAQHDVTDNNYIAMIEENT